MGGEQLSGSEREPGLGPRPQDPTTNLGPVGKKKKSQGGSQGCWTGQRANFLPVSLQKSPCPIYRENPHKEPVPTAKYSAGCCQPEESWERPKMTLRVWIRGLPFPVLSQDF